MISRTQFFAMLYLLLVQHGVLVAQAKRDGLVEVPQYLNLLQSPTVQKDLEIVDSQWDQLQQLSTERKTVLTLVLSKVDQLPVDERRGALQQLQEDMAALELKAYNVLIPFQRRRIDQLKNQTLMRASQPTAGLTHHRMVALLELTAEQQKAIHDRASEVDAKLQEKLEELRKQIEEEKAKTRRELLSLLTEQQRKIYQEVIGEIFNEDGPKFIPSAALISPKK